jgi:hypothetical protein
MARLRHPVNLYRLYAADGTLLYIGKGQMFERIYNHSISTQWFKQVVRAEIEHFDTQDEAKIAEATQIRDLKPKHNKLRVYSILNQTKGAS